jgi:hypothetical protein
MFDAYLILTGMVILSSLVASDRCTLDLLSPLVTFVPMWFYVPVYQPLVNRSGGELDPFFPHTEDIQYIIGYANCDPVVHTVSPSRDARSKFYYDARSALLCDALNHPFPHVLWSFTRHSIQLFLYQLSFRTLGTRLRGVTAGWWAALRNIGQRQPVPRDIYNRCRALPSHGVECCPEHLRPDLKDSPAPHHPERVNRIIDTREEIKRV